MNDEKRGRQTVLVLTNRSGGAVAAGDIVILSGANAASFVTTTSAAQKAAAVGVALETIADNASGRILAFGYAPQVNLSASASLRDFLFTHTVAKQAAPSLNFAEGAFGQVLGAGTTPAALIWGQPAVALGAPGSLGTDALWTAKGDLVIGAANDSASILGVGGNSKVLTANDGATHGVEWADLPSTPVAKGATVRRTTTQAINVTTPNSTPVSFDTEDRDDDSYWTVGSPTRFTIPSSGWYIVTGHCSWSTGTSVKSALIRVDDTTDLARQGPTTTSAFYQNVAAVAYFTAGQYVELRVIATADLLAATFSIVRP